jgi:peptidoglycan/xylan/chitin deacetylase (PgdA/CDA1 family)
VAAPPRDLGLADLALADLALADHLMTAAPTVRLLSLITVIMLSLLGGVYTLGRALGAKQPDRPHAVAALSPRPAPGDRPTRNVDPAPEATQPAVPTSTPDPDVKPSTDDRPQLPLEENGPYGSRMTTGSHEVALTFDDGPDPTYTPQALALLRRYDVKATFCLIGTNVREYPELVREIVADGHTLCNHSRQVIRADLLRTNQAIRAAVPDARIAYYRQPGGNWTAGVVMVARELGMTPLHWAVDPRDWTVPGAGSIHATVTAETVAGDIVLLHDAGGNRQGTMLALRSILPNLTRRFYLEALPTKASPAR